MKPGRNDPCSCGSGKKYKHCHLPIDEVASAERRGLRHAHDTLLPRLIAAARLDTAIIPLGLAQFWDNAYGAEQLDQLDDLELRGADRFLTWLAFDLQHDEGHTLVETLAADPARLDDPAPLNSYELRLLREWTGVRMRAYTVQQLHKGRGVVLHDLLTGQPFELEDQAASRALEAGEVVVGHLLPVAGTCVLGGSAARLTADTAPSLRAFVGLHLDDLRRTVPDASWDDLIRTRSYILNQFVMQLPTDAPNPAIFDQILEQTRTRLAL